MRIEGAVALVTGANRGIGPVFVRGLLDVGARTVHAGARDPGRPADIPGVAVTAALDALPAGPPEVLVNEISRRTKAGVPLDHEVPSPGIAQQFTERVSA